MFGGEAFGLNLFATAVAMGTGVSLFRSLGWGWGFRGSYGALCRLRLWADLVGSPPTNWPSSGSCDGWCCLPVPDAGAGTTPTLWRILVSIGDRCRERP